MFLKDTRIDLVPSSREALNESSMAWKRYIDKRDISAVACPKCGRRTVVTCKCGEKINWREHIISDFLIGGHAKVHANRLITRDRGYYEKYFSGLEIMR